MFILFVLGSDVLPVFLRCGVQFEHQRALMRAW